MKIAVIAHTDLPLALLDPKQSGAEECLFACEDPALARRARRRGFTTVTGPLDDLRTYRRLHISRNDQVLVCLESRQDQDRCFRALFEVHPKMAVTALHGPRSVPHPRWEGAVLALPMEKVGAAGLLGEMEKASTRRAVATVRELFKGAERVLLLVQEDPDPDGIASALALRTLLGRNRLSAVIGSFGAVKRPENVSMVRLLDINVQQLRPEQITEFDRVALLDVQPLHSPGIPTDVDLVIDHHPRRSQLKARFRDIRPRYGATSTILTEYLLASDTPISQRLATALLYGIKTDTQLLGRDTTAKDVAAFSSLYPLVNHATLRRIDHPQFPRRDLASLSHALTHAEIVDDILFAYLGPLTREDVIPYIADFCLEVEAVEWSVVSGLYEGKLIISIRYLAGARHAGEVTRAAFEAYGSAGGHRAMSKAVIPLVQIPQDCLAHDSWVRDRFLVALHEGRQTTGEPATG
ncbi:MAG TPA: DHH family phosphoesterase [Deferrisomatales bacterium]|nr:DHH family phosphoesterase [Deferrisomatales bacterium]